jgi:hypothetical protein
MLETNGIALDALEKDALSARNAIAKLTKSGIYLSSVTIEQLNLILFSDDSNEALGEVVNGMPKEEMGKLLAREADGIVQSGIPVTLHSEEYEEDEEEEEYSFRIEYDGDALQSALDKLSVIFNSEACHYTVKEKADLVIRFIVKVLSDIDLEMRNDDYEYYEDFKLQRKNASFPSIFADIALKTFPSLGLTKEEILNSCA